MTDDGTLVIPGFFSPEECSLSIAKSEAAGYGAATIQTRKGAVTDPEIRNNERLIVDDADWAKDLWSRLRPHLPAFVAGRRVSGVNERFRFYRYDPGQYFAPHTDGVFRRDNGEESRFTLLIYLNGDFAGGETVFAEKIVKPEMGLALVFRHELLHEGRAVIRGRKYVLRSDVMFNPIGRVSG